MSFLINIMFWIANGFLVLVYFIVQNLATLGLVFSCALFVIKNPHEQKTWAASSGALGLIASILAPFPVPLFLLLLSLVGWIVLYLEQYNPLDRQWDIIRGLGLYGLIGIGYAAYQLSNLAERIMTDPMTAQGGGYLNAIIGIVTYIFPLGILAFWAQAVFAHPPGVGRPEEILKKVRTRGKH